MIKLLLSKKIWIAKFQTFYVLICKGCPELYIGQIGDKLRNRIAIHNQQIRDPSTRQIPFSTHVDSCSKTNPKNSFFPLFQVQIK